MIISKKIILSLITVPFAGGGVYLYNPFSSQKKEQPTSSAKSKNYSSEETKSSTLKDTSAVNQPVQVSSTVNTVSPSKPSGLGNTESGNWKVPTPKRTQEGYTITSEVASPCQTMYFVEGAKWSSDDDLETFEKRTKFTQIEDLIRSGKIENKWKNSFDISQFCSPSKPDVYAWMGRGDQLRKMAVNSQELENSRK